MADEKDLGALATKLSRFINLSRDELQLLAELQSRSVKLKRGEELTGRGAERPHGPDPAKRLGVQL